MNHNEISEIRIGTKDLKLPHKTAISCLFM